MYPNSLTPEKIAIMNGVRMGLLQLIAHGGLDHSQLSQYMGALRVFCDDPRYVLCTLTETDE